MVSMHCGGAKQHKFARWLNSTSSGSFTCLGKCAVSSPPTCADVFVDESGARVAVGSEGGLVRNGLSFRLDSSFCWKGLKFPATLCDILSHSGEDPIALPTTMRSVQISVFTCRDGELSEYTGLKFHGEPYNVSSVFSLVLRI